MRSYKGPSKCCNSAPSLKLKLCSAQFMMPGNLQDITSNMCVCHGYAMESPKLSYEIYTELFAERYNRFQAVENMYQQICAYNMLIYIYYIISLYLFMYMYISIHVHQGKVDGTSSQFKFVALIYLFKTVKSILTSPMVLTYSTWTLEQLLHIRSEITKGY